MRRLLATAAVAGNLLLGPAAALPARAQAQAPKSLRQPAFEVAAVKLCPPGDSGLTSMSPMGSTRFHATNASLPFLIEVAFGVANYQIAGEPKWSDSALYDISAEAAPGTTLNYEKLKPLLQQLLEQRLHLRIHREMRNMKGYALVVAKGGPKLKSSKGTGTEAYILTSGLRGHVSMPALATMLWRPTGRPIVDRTGIKGNYDIKLDYAPNDAVDSPLPSVFTAVQEQLGLKLKPQRVPVQMLVIDHVDRKPTEN